MTSLALLEHVVSRARESADDVDKEGAHHRDGRERAASSFPRKTTRWREKKKVFVLFVDGETKELCRSGHAAQILISSQVRMMMMKDRGVTWAPHFVDRDVTLAASSCLSRMHFFVSDSKEREKKQNKKTNTVPHFFFWRYHL